MEVFNLAEELEKERKKNKELQDNIDDLINSNCQLNEYIEQLENRTNKAIEYIENKNKYLDSENYYQVFEYRDMYLMPLLDILQGDNK